jgi:mannose-6-phosphate isomerase-like protein (cupin superfamily)
MHSSNYFNHNLKYSVRQYNLEDDNALENLLSELHKEFPFCDTYKTSTPAEIKCHIHTDIESRLFLSGNARFNIDGAEVHCGPGTYIYIDANVPHSFIYEGEEPLKVLRFFKTNENWKAIYL